MAEKAVLSLGTIRSDDDEDGEIEDDEEDTIASPNHRDSAPLAYTAPALNNPNASKPPSQNPNVLPVKAASPKPPASPASSYDEGEIPDASDDEEFMQTITAKDALTQGSRLEQQKQTESKGRKAHGLDLHGYGDNDHSDDGVDDQDGYDERKDAFRNGNYKDDADDDEDEEGLIDGSDDDDDIGGFENEFKGMTLEQLKKTRYYYDTNTSLYYDTWTGVYVFKNPETGAMLECLNPYTANRPKLRLICLRSKILSQASLVEVEPYGATFGNTVKEGNHFCFDDGEVAFNHCAIGYDSSSKSFFIQDRGSLNGTHVNGHRLGSSGLPFECQIETATIIQIGSSVFQAHVHEIWPSDCQLCRVAEDITIEFLQPGETKAEPDILSTLDPNTIVTRALMRRIRRLEVNRLKRILGIPIKKKGLRARLRRRLIREALRNAAPDEESRQIAYHKLMEELASNPISDEMLDKAASTAKKRGKVAQKKRFVAKLRKSNAAAGQTSDA